MTQPKTTTIDSYQRERRIMAELRKKYDQDRQDYNRRHAGEDCLPFVEFRFWVLTERGRS